ncbi:MAG TPA: DUF4249 domain-containing protein [Ohtaekwangia sp.]
MKSFSILGLLLIVNGILLTGCVEPYPPPVTDDQAGYLVVDGYLNSSTGTITVKLTRAIPLSSVDIPPTEPNALITLEDSDGNTFMLTEEGNGKYSLSGVPTDFSKQYRLLITTAENKNYISEFVEIKQAPPIDELTWVPTDNGVKIQVDTHDDTQKSIYYKWSFEETYEQHAVYYSAYEYNGGDVKLRTPENDVYTCWKDEISQNIIIGTSQRLSTDIINDFPVTLIPPGSPKIYVRYSILVKQRVLTKEAYTYYDKLKKTTEDLGGLFDPQPGQVTGNFKSVSDPSEIVIGYFSGGSEESERMFITLSDLPQHLRGYQSEGACSQDTVKLEELPFFSDGPNLLINGQYEGITLVGYTFAPTGCADCRRKGGTTERPDFW